MEPLCQCLSEDVTVLNVICERLPALTFGDPAGWMMFTWRELQHPSVSSSCQVLPCSLGVQESPVGFPRIPVSCGLAGQLFPPSSGTEGMENHKGRQAALKAKTGPPLSC